MTEPAQPSVQIVRGAPDEWEVAALVAGLASGAVDEEIEAPADAAGAWTRNHGVRAAMPFGVAADAWRWSLRS